MQLGIVCRSQFLRGLVGVNYLSKSLVVAKDEGMILPVGVSGLRGLAASHHPGKDNGHRILFLKSTLAADLPDVDDARGFERHGPSAFNRKRMPRPIVEGRKLDLALSILRRSGIGDQGEHQGIAESENS